MAAKLVEQWLKIARGEISSQSTNVVNKENLLTSQSQIIVNSDNSLDSCLPVSEINGNDVIDSVNDDSSLSERIENESLVFKISVKDGKQTLAKVNDASPKKNHIKDHDSTSKSRSDSIDKKSSSKSSESRSKDGKDRDKSKDRHHKKSSSSSSHKTSSSSSKTSSSSSSSKHSSSSKSHKSTSSSSGHKISSSSSSRDKDRHKSKSSSSSSSKEKRDEKEKIKIDAKVSQAEKDKDTLAKIQAVPLPKVKIPKKITDDSEKTTEKPIEKPTENGTMPSKKKSISIEVRKDTENRPKTAKTYNSQFRNHGLAEEAPPPPSRRDLKKPSSVPTTGLAIASNPVTKRSLSPTNIVKEAEKKIKLQVTSPTIEKPGAIKLIPPKPKRKYQFELSFNRIFFVAFSFDRDRRGTRCSLVYVKRPFGGEKLDQPNVLN